MFDYPTLTPDDGSVLVTFPDVSEAITFGINEEDALIKAVDALKQVIVLSMPANHYRCQSTSRWAKQYAHPHWN
jgi:predicted RNase H-like HicB family nuclease